MNRYSNIIISTLLPTLIKSAPCLDPMEPFEFRGHCTYENVLEAYSKIFDNDDDVLGPGADCTNDAEKDLWEQLGATTLEGAKAEVRSSCIGAYESANKTPFSQSVKEGTDLKYEKIYFDGSTNLNEESETLFPRDFEDPEHPSNILRDRNGKRGDAGQVRRFYRGFGTYSQVEFPDSIENFDSCRASSVMCCWPRDRQANDNNGNCEEPYDENCVDADPADNTDLCHVDMERGAESTSFGSGGVIVHPGDDNNESDDAEGPIHCHGFAWSSVDPYDFTSRYKGNNLHYVSLYDHLHQRGYVENIQGAPMCGCVEKMPVVSSSDCTQIDVEERFSFRKKANAASGFDATMTFLEIDFNSCQGIQNKNNDLWAYMGRLFMEGKVTAAEWVLLNKYIVEDNNCPVATKKRMAELGMVTGYNPDAKWQQVAGRDTLAYSQFGPKGFTKLYDGSDTGIVMRLCLSCTSTDHKKMFYRRTENAPATEDTLDWLMNYVGGDAKTNHKHKVDFELYSTYDDALARTNAWNCGESGYEHNSHFPGNCGPDSRVTNQYNRFEWYGGRQDVAFFLDKTSQNPVTYTDEQMDVVDPPYRLSAVRKFGNDIAITSSGRDIWSRSDQFTFHNELYATTEGIQITVAFKSMDSYNSWAKGGIMIRESLAPGSRYVFLYNSGHNGLHTQIRYSVDSNTNFYNYVYDKIDSIWLRIRRDGDVFTFFISNDSTDLPVSEVTWEEFDSPRTFTGFSQEALVGLAFTSHDNNYADEAFFASYSVATSTSPSRSLLRRNKA